MQTIVTQDFVSFRHILTSTLSIGSEYFKRLAFLIISLIIKITLTGRITNIYFITVVPILQMKKLRHK